MGPNAEMALARDTCQPNFVACSRKVKELY